MKTPDDWGRDPGVRRTRELFARMEAGQRDLLHRLRISPTDERLRGWRDAARRRFERSWAEAGWGRGGDDAAALYVRCLEWVLAEDGVSVPGAESAIGEGRA